MYKLIRGASALALLALMLPTSPVFAHGGGGLNYISTVRSAPVAPGVTATVQDRDDRLLVRNRGRSTVTIYGYNREPYARIQPDGRVQVNQRSPALYLNEDRFAEVDVPSRASAKAAPVWKTLDNTGSFDWHDHRIHWMVKKRPGKVTDKDKRTKVFDWKVPVRVDGRPTAISGDLYWVPRPGGGFPLAAGIALGAVILAGVSLVVVVRRRRRSASPGPVEEAW